MQPITNLIWTLDITYLVYLVWFRSSLPCSAAKSGTPPPLYILSAIRWAKSKPSWDLTYSRLYEVRVQCTRNLIYSRPRGPYSRDPIYLRLCTRSGYTSLRVFETTIRGPLYASSDTRVSVCWRLLYGVACALHLIHESSCIGDYYTGSLVRSIWYTSLRVLETTIRGPLYAPFDDWCLVTRVTCAVVCAG